MATGIRFKTATFILLSFSILLALAAFLSMSYYDTRAIVSKQLLSHSESLVAQYEKALATYMDLVEENVVTIRSNASLIATFYVQDEAGFNQTLSAWEEDYERGRYDFLAVYFPQRQQCSIFRGFFTGLDNLDCTSLFQVPADSENYGWKVVDIENHKLAVYTSPVYLRSSGKMIGQLVGGIKLANNTYLLNLIVDDRSRVSQIELVYRDEAVSQLSFKPQDPEVVHHRNPVVLSAGETVLGTELQLRLESADNSLVELRNELLDTFLYSGLATILLVSVLSIQLSRSLDSQLQSLMAFVRFAHLNRNTRWKRTQIREFNALGQQIIDIVQDLQAQEELLRRNNEDKRRILQHLIETEEKERLRLSNDLHDDVGQLLAAMKTNLYFIRDEHDSLQFESRALKTTLDIVGLMYDAIYHRIGLLRSSEEMQHFGLAGSLPLITVIPQLENLDYAVELDINQSRPLRKETMVNLYRISQEALTNVLKYASGTWVLVRLSDEPAGLRLRIQDDGVGFMEGGSVSEGGGGFGLISMRERTDQLGGKFTITGDDGVTVDVFIPARLAYLQPGETNELMDYVASERNLPPKQQ